MSRVDWGRTHLLAAVVALACLFAASSAQADEVSANVVAHEESGSFTIEATFDVGIADVIDVSMEDDDGNRESEVVHASPTLGFTPALGYKLSDVMEVGAELVVVWIVPEAATSRRMVLSPHGRIRFSFPVYDKVTLDGTLAVGASFWGEADEEEDERELNEFRDSRAGWSLRMAVGGGYAFTSWLTAYGSFGYYTSQTFGNDLTTRFGTVLFSAGARVGF